MVMLLHPLLEPLAWQAAEVSKLDLSRSTGAVLMAEHCGCHVNSALICGSSRQPAQWRSLKYRLVEARLS